MGKISTYVFCLFILAGCGAGYRARVLLNDAEADLKQAEIYRAREFAPYEWSEASNSIRATRFLLDMGRNNEALKEALEAKTGADDALRLSRKSVAAISIKKARDAQNSVEENRAFRENEELYQRMLSETQNAENAFIADRFDVCISFSEKAVTHARILLEPIKKEAEMIRERVSSAWMDAGKNTKQSKELEALIGEGEEAFQAQRYTKAVFIWEKAEKELRSPED